MIYRSRPSWPAGCKPIAGSPSPGSCRCVECAEYRVSRCQCQVCNADVAAAGEHGRSTGGFATLCRSSRCRTNPAGQRAAYSATRGEHIDHHGRQFPGKRRQPCDRIRDGRSRRFGPEHNSPRPRQRTGQYRRERRNDDGRQEIEECVGARRCRRTSANSAGGGRSRDNSRRRRRPRKCPARRGRASSRSERSDDATGFDCRSPGARGRGRQRAQSNRRERHAGSRRQDGVGPIRQDRRRIRQRPRRQRSGRRHPERPAPIRRNSRQISNNPRRHSRPPPTRRNRSRRRW